MSWSGLIGDVAGIGQGDVEAAESSLGVGARPEGRAVRVVSGS